MTGTLAAIAFVALVFIVAGLVARRLVVIVGFDLILPIVFILIVLHLHDLSLVSGCLWCLTSLWASPRDCSNPETNRRKDARHSQDSGRRNRANSPAVRYDSRCR